MLPPEPGSATAARQHWRNTTVLDKQPTVRPGAEPPALRCACAVAVRGPGLRSSEIGKSGAGARQNRLRLRGGLQPEIAGRRPAEKPADLTAGRSGWQKHRLRLRGRPPRDTLFYLDLSFRKGSKHLCPGTSLGKSEKFPRVLKKSLKQLEEETVYLANASQSSPARTWRKACAQTVSFS